MRVVAPAEAALFIVDIVDATTTSRDMLPHIRVELAAGTADSNLLVLLLKHLELLGEVLNHLRDLILLTHRGGWGENVLC